MNSDTKAKENESLPNDVQLGRENTGMSTRALRILLALAILALALLPTRPDAPKCWEDETVVIVVETDRYECVPWDDLTAGYRP